MIDSDNECTPKDKTIAKESSTKKIRTDSIFLQDNINRFHKQLFLDNIQQLTRYNIERRWLSIVKDDDDIRLPSENEINEITYWTYPARKIYRAVSEPNLQTMHILGTTILRKSNSFHDLYNFKRSFKPCVKPFMGKLINWQYVTRAQCLKINFTKTDKDLINTFDDIFEWETTIEKKIMSRLFADVAKYCKKYELNDEKMSTLLGVYCYTHKYNKSLDILSYEEVYDFFKELVIHHSVLSPPDHINLYSIEEAKNILKHFLNKYLTCLPLIRHLCLPKIVQSKVTK